MAFYRSSSFQIPDIRRYPIGVQRTGLSLFHTAGKYSYNVDNTEPVSSPLSVDSLIKHAGCRKTTVMNGLRCYEADGYNRRDGVRFQTQNITFLNPATKEPLRSTKQKYGLLSRNDWTARDESFQRFLTIPTVRL